MGPVPRLGASAQPSIPVPSRECVFMAQRQLLEPHLCVHMCALHCWKGLSWDPAGWAGPRPATHHLLPEKLPGVLEPAAKVSRCLRSLKRERLERWQRGQTPSPAALGSKGGCSCLLPAPSRLVQPSLVLSEGPLGWARCPSLPRHPLSFNKSCPIGSRTVMLLKLPRLVVRHVEAGEEHAPLLWPEPCPGGGPTTDAPHTGFPSAGPAGPRPGPNPHQVAGRFKLHENPEANHPQGPLMTPEGKAGQGRGAAPRRPPAPSKLYQGTALSWPPCEQSGIFWHVPGKNNGFTR